MIRFELLQQKDLERLMEIEKKAFSKNTWENREVYEKRINTFPEGNLGIWFEDKFIGFICSELWNYEKTYNKDRFMLSHNIEDYHSFSGEELYISSFAIDESFSGKGFGKLSFENFLLEIPKKYNIKSSILLVSSQWTGAIKIYKNMSYKELDRIESFFTNDNEIFFDGIIMRKEL